MAGSYEFSLNLEKYLYYENLVGKDGAGGREVYFCYLSVLFYKALVYGRRCEGRWVIVCSWDGSVLELGLYCSYDYYTDGQGISI